MNLTRREMILTSGAALAGSTMLHFAGRVQAKQVVRDKQRSSRPAWEQPPLEPGTNYTPVITPDNSALDYRIVDGVKVYHLIAEPVRHEFAPGFEGNCWGYNGRVHGPTIEAVEGDRVDVRRVQHELDAHEDGHGVPSREHPVEAEREEDRADHQIVVQAHVH